MYNSVCVCVCVCVCLCITGEVLKYIILHLFLKFQIHFREGVIVCVALVIIFKDGR